MNKDLRHAISDKDTESFSMQLKHLIKFGEKINDRWVYRFARHPRFGYWAYNMLYRKRLLSQDNFYIKQNMNDNVLTIEELRQMLHSDSYGNIMNKIQYYAKNVSGTNSYWFQVKQQLKCTLQQLGSPTIFFTLSCAEFHWPEFHSIFRKQIFVLMRYIGKM